MAVGFNTSFRGVDPHSVAAAKNASSKFADGISAETQKAIREIIERSIAEGITPANTAKLIRPLIGLTSKQAESVQKRTLKTFATKGIEAATKEAEKYGSKLLRKRAETIARTEIMRAQNTGQRAAWDEAVTDGTIAPESQKVWIVAEDDRLCPYCSKLADETVPLDGKFSSAFGVVSEPPLHPNCRCTVGLVPVETSKVQPLKAAAPQVVSPPPQRPERKTSFEAAPSRQVAEMQAQIERQEALAAEAAQKAAIEAAQKAAAEAAKMAEEAVKKAVEEAAALTAKVAAEEAKKAHLANAMAKMMEAQQQAQAIEKQIAFAKTPEAVAKLEAQKKAAEKKLLKAIDSMNKTPQTPEQLARLKLVRESGTTKWLDDMLARGQVGPQAGSNPGGVYQDVMGRRFYVKRYDNEGQALSEVVSNAVYRELGLGGPKSFAVRSSTGQMHFASEIVENSGTVGQLGLTKESAQKILKGFSADVLTVNWDAVGTGLDNVVISGKKVVRIDQGGTLLFRAQGGAKPMRVFTDISEWDSLVTQNRYYRQVFEKAGLAPNTLGKLGIQQITDIENLRNNGGWKKFVARALGKSTKGNQAFINQTADLLEKRTNLLLMKRAELESVLNVPAPARSTAQWPIADNVIRQRGARYAEVIAAAHRGNLALLSREANNGFRAYTSSAYHTQNSRLRAFPQVVEGTDKAMQDALTSGMAHRGVPELVWRSISEDAGRLIGFKPGAVVQMNGFQSTSLDPGFATNWSSVVLEIKPARGLYVRELSHHSSEYEYLLPHAQRYRVIAKKTVQYLQHGAYKTAEVWQLEML